MTANNSNLKDFNTVRGMGAAYKRQFNELARSLGNIKGENGIYVFKAVGATSGNQQALAQVKDQIYGKLLEDQFEAKFKEWVDKLREKAYVEIK